MNKANKKQRKPVLPPEDYIGNLLIDGVQFPIQFVLSADSECRLSFEIEKVDAKTYVAVHGNSDRPGQPITGFSITGTSPSGKTFHTDTAFLSGSGSGTKGFSIKIKVSTATLSYQLDKPAAAPVMKLWFRSFRSFSNPIFETPLGRLQVYGATTTAHPDEMSGSVALQADPATMKPDWRENADRFLRHLQSGLALAHGGRLECGLLEYYGGTAATFTFYQGKGYRPEFPVQYQLNHGPYIQALVDRYFVHGPLPETLWIALSWMQIVTTFDEVRFLTAMTALETIIESQLPETRGTLLPKPLFQRLLGTIRHAISSDAEVPETALEVMSKKVSSLNTKPAAAKFEALFDHYQISRRDFGAATIAQLLKLRNQIVHRGQAPDGTDLWPSIILLRELITRILLSEIGFVGRYCCYIGGLNDRDFPEPQ